MGVDAAEPNTDIADRAAVLFKAVIANPEAVTDEVSQLVSEARVRVTLQASRPLCGLPGGWSAVSCGLVTPNAPWTRRCASPGGIGCSTSGARP